MSKQSGTVTKPEAPRRACSLWCLVSLCFSKQIGVPKYSQALASFEVQRGQLVAVGAGLAGLAGARCGRLRDGRGVGDGLTSRVMRRDSREEIADGGGILPCIFAFISGNSGFLDLFCPQEYEILYLGSDDEMSHLTAKNSQKHEVDGPQ
jgi:hypothetical protein